MAKHRKSLSWALVCEAACIACIYDTSFKQAINHVVNDVMEKRTSTLTLEDLADSAFNLGLDVDFIFKPKDTS